MSKVFLVVLVYFIVLVSWVILADFLKNLSGKWNPDEDNIPSFCGKYQTRNRDTQKDGKPPPASPVSIIIYSTIR